ncbi:putative flippase GtrA [Humitalea rosea]|uniref:Putative flippase GtrA n=1 Tax=Humitalea rosea TaxID=990373 RepID=A0A2W7IPG6_9PROT|nr:GtrA family protein [Humitalea rosea]PZW49127.1 putative flippase GtrA [Humitalea rosea]
MPVTRTIHRLFPRQGPLVLQMWRFGVVGGLGFLVDTAVLYAALGLGAGLYGGRVLSYIAAASFTWALNRAWTFSDRARVPVARQWALFLVVNLGGFALNYGTYAAMVAFWPLAAAWPVLGVAGGAIAGMGCNFWASRALVFRQA